MGKNILNQTPIFFLILATFANYWWIPAFRTNFLYGILLIFLTFLLFIISSRLFKKENKLLIIITGVVFTVLSTLQLRYHFDHTLNTITPTEDKILRQRHILYAEGLGPLFTNRISLNYYKNWSLPVEKNLRNISYSLDPNLYFFTSHPREKSGIDEIEKYPPILLPFFILGLLSYLVNLPKNRWLNIYLVTSVGITSFLSPYFKLGPILFFPFINVVIANGAFLIFKKVLEKGRKP